MVTFYNKYEIPSMDDYLAQLQTFGRPSAALD